MIHATLRHETQDDAPAIAELVTLAFGDEGPSTARFVRAVRAQAFICWAQVAIADGELVGHAQWCEAPLLVDGFRIKAAYLACLSVKPALHGLGIGSALVTRGLSALTDAGFQAVTLLGDPTYYARFGFSSTRGQRISGPHRLKGPGFQALELVKGALNGVTLVSDYPDVLTPPS